MHHLEATAQSGGQGGVVLEELLNGVVGRDYEALRPERPGGALDLGGEVVLVCPELQEGAYPGDVTGADLFEKHVVLPGVPIPPLVEVLDVRVV